MKMNNEKTVQGSRSVYTFPSPQRKGPTGGWVEQGEGKVFRDAPCLFLDLAFLQNGMDISFSK
jgi:hypothetical protein